VTDPPEGWKSAYEAARRHLEARDILLAARQLRIDDLEAEIARLKARIDRLEDEIRLLPRP
jgi:cell division protein FtsB